MRIEWRIHKSDGHTDTQTHRRTDRATSWAPVGAKKFATDKFLFSLVSSLHSPGLNWLAPLGSVSHSSLSWWQGCKFVRRNVCSQQGQSRAPLSDCLWSLSLCWRDLDPGDPDWELGQHTIRQPESWRPENGKIRPRVKHKERRLYSESLHKAKKLAALGLWPHSHNLIISALQIYQMQLCSS